MDFKKFFPSLVAVLPVVAVAVVPQAQELVKDQPLYAMLLSAIMAVILHLKQSPLTPKE